MALTTEQSPLAVIRASLVSSSSPRAPRGPLFPHDSDTARFYVALYPRGLAAKAAEAAGVSAARAQEITAFLAERRLIAAENGVWRCTMPLLSDVDLEVLRPWAVATAAVVTDRLEELHAAALAMAEHLVGQSARETVLAAALIGEAETVPTQAVFAAMELAAPDRGLFGRWVAAAATAEDLPRGWDYGMGSGQAETPWGMLHSYRLDPAGLDRCEVEVGVYSRYESG